MQAAIDTLGTANSVMVKVDGVELFNPDKLKMVFAGKCDQLIDMARGAAGIGIITDRELSNFKRLLTRINTAPNKTVKNAVDSQVDKMMRQA